MKRYALDRTHLSRMQETRRLSTSQASMFSSFEMNGICILVYGVINLMSTCVRMLRSRSATTQIIFMFIYLLIAQQCCQYPRVYSIRWVDGSEQERTQKWSRTNLRIHPANASRTRGTFRTANIPAKIWIGHTSKVRSVSSTVSTAMDIYSINNKWEHHYEW